MHRDHTNQHCSCYSFVEIFSVSIDTIQCQFVNISWVINKSTVKFCYNYTHNRFFLPHESEVWGVFLSLVSDPRDHSGYGLSQWEEVLLCNTFCHRLSPYPEWSLDLCSTLAISVLYHVNGFVLPQDLYHQTLNTMRPRENGCHFTDNIFKCIFLNENVWIAIRIPLKFVPWVPIDNKPSLVQIMVWRLKQATSHCMNQWWPISLTRIYTTHCQWVKRHGHCYPHALAHST